MPELDTCHPQVVRALEKDGWKVSRIPLRLSMLERTIHIDIEASRSTNGDRKQILLAEVKCFQNASKTSTDLYLALGQYVLYRAMLAEMAMAIPLYLVVPETFYDNGFDFIVQRAVSDSKIKLVVVDLNEEKVTQWKE